MLSTTPRLQLFPLNPSHLWCNFSCTISHPTCSSAIAWPDPLVSLHRTPPLNPTRKKQRMRSSPILLVSRATCCTSFNRTGPGSDAPQRHLHRQDNMPHFTQPTRRKPRRITEMLVDTNLNHVSAIFNGNKRLSRDFRRLHCSKRPQCDRNESLSLPLPHKTTKGAAI